MTKKETAVVENLKRELRLKGALRATTNVEPDVPIPEPSYGSAGKLSKGFMFVGDRSDWPRVEPACSSSVCHNFGRGRPHQRAGARTSVLYPTTRATSDAVRHGTRLLPSSCCRVCDDRKRVGEVVGERILIAAVLWVFVVAPVLVYNRSKSS